MIVGDEDNMSPKTFFQKSAKWVGWLKPPNTVQGIWHGVFFLWNVSTTTWLFSQELMTAAPERVCGELLSGAGIRNAMWLCALRTLANAMMGYTPGKLKEKNRD